MFRKVKLADGSVVEIKKDAPLPAGATEMAHDAEGEGGELDARIERTVARAVQPILDQLKAKATNNMGGAPTTDTEQTDRAPITGKEVADGTGINFARYVKAIGVAKMEGHSNPSKVAERWGYKSVAKALNQASSADGGLLVRPEYSSEFFEILRPRTIVRKHARQVPLEGLLEFLRQTASGTAAYSGEQDVIAASQPKVAAAQLQEKELKALSIISNTLIKNSSISAEEFVRDDMIAVMARREDLAFLRGDGTLNTPKGILNWMAVANKVNATQAGAEATLAEVKRDLAKVLYKLQAADAPMIKLVWTANPRIINFMLGLLDGNGNAVFEALLASGKFYMGAPYETSTQIPMNLNELGGSNETEVTVFDASECIIGQGRQAIEVFPNGTYEEGGVVKSGISRNQTVIRNIQYHDFLMRHAESAAQLKQCKWGA